ncbi:hypothetical protein L6452_03102 [Arctium lappa]|uniref:Uncharacterized protein n=1 Tax=Arctium lappa TaxID=4217 RepID=A0ACB9FLA9_ARCLA|nr:hypothetical protein L6452_03102 [Arctium lappa]
MVKNLIPLFLIKTVLEAQCKQTTHKLIAEQTQKSMLMGLYHELSPFQEQELPDVDINDCNHFLDFLYHMIVPNNKELGIVEVEIDIENEDIIEIKGQEEEESFAKVIFVSSWITCGTRYRNQT